MRRRREQRVENEFEKRMILKRNDRLKRITVTVEGGARGMNCVRWRDI
jgi:hypothetical protein